MHFPILSRRMCRAAPLALALVFLPPASSSAESRFFAADESGYQGPALPQDSASGWVLEIRDGPKGETRILRKDGIEFETTVVEPLASGRKESLSRGGKPAAYREFDRSGAILLEREYGSSPDGSAFVEKRYTYGEGRLVRIEAKDQEGVLQGTLSYRYDPKGRLSRLAATGSFGSETLGAIQGGLGPSIIWSQDPVTEKGGELTVFYDEAMRPMILERRAGDELLRRESLVFSSAGLVERRIVELPASGETTASDYDAQGRLVSAVTTAAGKESYREEWTYDGKGRPVRKESRTKGRIVVVTTVWNDEEGSSRETTSENSAVVSVVLSLPDGSSVKEFFDKGKLFLRSTWSGGRLVKEEFLSDGRILRTRTYP